MTYYDLLRTISTSNEVYVCRFMYVATYLTVQFHFIQKQTERKCCVLGIGSYFLKRHQPTDLRKKRKIIKAKETLVLIN